MTILEKKSAKETLEHLKPKPELDSPRRSWLYILLGIVLIFGLTFIFQELNESSVDVVDPSSFEQLKEEVRDLNVQVNKLEQRIQELESR